MTRRRRIDRKLHRKFLHIGVIDASKHGAWRRRLFSAPPNQLFPIDAWHTDSLPSAVSDGIRQYRLRYTVCRVEHAPPSFADMGYEGCVWFRFRAYDYPDIVTYSSNNPAVV
jgi:hypothetical protein